MTTGRLRFAAVSLVLAAGLAPAFGGPQDTRVGETRVIFQQAGATIRAEAQALGAAVATLPRGTQVTVLEVKLPWVKVRAATGQEGWLRAFEAVEPTALAAAPPPPAPSGAGAGVSAREVSAAGRQLTADTERAFRASRADLVRGYALVDQMEKDTAAMSPYDALEFLMEVELGRRGRDYQLPARLPPDPPLQRKKAGGDLGKKVGGLLGKLGVKEGEQIGELVSGVQALSGQLEKSFTPQQEYYVGRAVAAQAFAKFGADPDANRRRYVKRIGDALVRVADPARVRPNFGGYHFDVLDCPDVNGISGPGGFVLVTRGAVLACKTEDEVAGLLAHELAHVVGNGQMSHGEQVLRRGEKFQNSLKGFGHFAKAAGVDESRLGAQLLQVFETAVGEMGRTAMEHGYGKDLEFVADREGTYLLYDVLYDWTSIRSFLGRMGASGHAHGGATHASPEVRASALDPVLAPYGAFSARPGVKESRIARFERHVGR
jgi:hypothetical protein